MRRQGPAPDAAIPVTLLTGFLGSGKTTLLNALLRQPALAQTLVVINEFGAIALAFFTAGQAPIPACHH